MVVYAIRLKDKEMYLEEGGSYTPNPLEADCFFDFADAKSFASAEEEVVSVDEDGKVEVIR